MSNKQFYAIIMAGGKGERFWPYSTELRPKQLLSLVGGKPMLAMAVERLSGLISPDHVYVITNTDLVDACRKAAPELPSENIIGEPVGRDTAAAIALGAAIVKSRDPKAAFCVLTADHIIGDLDLFRATLRESLALSLKEDVLITIGIQPAGPSTGYGYIEAGPQLRESSGVLFHRALRFVEKPDENRAKQYVESGNYFWNSGMFIWSVAAIEKALAMHRAVLADLMNRLAPMYGSDRFDSLLTESYDKLEKISIDYAIMEKADNIVMVKGTFRWDDVGSWPALADHLPKDASGNTVLGDCQALESADNIVVSENRVTALIGVKDLIVVHAEGATLICPRERAQEIKEMVHQLRAAGRYGKVL